MALANVEHVQECFPKHLYKNEHRSEDTEVPKDTEVIRSEAWLECLEKEKRRTGFAIPWNNLRIPKLT